VDKFFKIYFLMKHEEKNIVPSDFFRGSTTILTFEAQNAGCVMHKKLLQRGSI
jgi:hypothetical protein